MRPRIIFILILGMLGWLAPPALVSADTPWSLNFIPTQNAPAGAQGTMTFSVGNGKTTVTFSVTGVYPHTIYTIWTVFNVLICPSCGNGAEVPACPAASADSRPECTTLAGGTSWIGRPGFSIEGNGVSPLARLDAAFTDGMGLDPGASFVTDDKGNGAVQLTLDYDLLGAAPVSNSKVIPQCVPLVPAGATSNCIAATVGGAQTPGLTRRVTTTWLRTFIGEFALANRAAQCANYDPTADPDNALYDPVAGHGTDARFWQCVDPATADPSTGNGLPRVRRFLFDHFRLANHPDDLTHGFIGGNATDHWIDMVGVRCTRKDSTGKVMQGIKPSLLDCKS